MTLPTKILLAALLMLGMKVYGDVSADDEATAKFHAATANSNAHENGPAAESSSDVLKPELADNAIEAGSCTVDCHAPNSSSKTLVHHNNFSDLKHLAETGRNSAKEP